MNSQLDKMISMLKFWLEKNDLHTDTHFYTPEKWKERGEDYHNDAELIITTEGGLYTILNWGDSTEFDDLVEAYGFFYELGHSWNLGFYCDPEWKTPNVNLTYSQKLKDERWRNKRELVLERANRRCEDCKSKENLEIHHCYYKYGLEPWQYPLDALRCLCKICHQKRDGIEKILRGHLASLTASELKSFTDLIKDGFHIYKREEVFNVLRSLRKNETEIKDSVEKLFKSKIG